MQISLTISQNGINSLSIIKKWSFFLSIVGFVLSGVMIIIGILMAFLGDKFSKMEHGASFPSVIFLIMYSIIGIVYFFPSFYLLKFSQNTKTAIETGTESSIDNSFKYLQSFFTFAGVLTIISIAFMLLGLFAGIVAAIFMSSSAHMMNS